MPAKKPDPLQPLRDNIARIDKDIASDDTPAYVRPQLVRARTVLSRELDRQAELVRSAGAGAAEGSAPRKSQPQRPRRSPIKATRNGFTIDTVEGKRVSGRGMTDDEYNAAIKKGEPF